MSLVVAPELWFEVAAPVADDGDEVASLVPVGLEGFGATVPLGPSEFVVRLEVSVVAGALEDGGNAELLALEVAALGRLLSWLAHDNTRHTALKSNSREMLYVQVQSGWLGARSVEPEYTEGDIER